MAALTAAAPFAGDVATQAEWDAVTTSVAARTHGVLVLLWAPWCGHCIAYKPTWDDVLANTPGRVVPMVKVQDTARPAIPLFAKASIPGYPSVVAIPPPATGTLLHFPDPEQAGRTTDAVPYMRNTDVMKRVLRGQASLTGAAGNTGNSGAMKGGTRRRARARARARSRSRSRSHRAKRRKH